MKKNFFTILSLTLFSFGVMAQAPTQQWAKEYDNPNGGSNQDTPEEGGIVVDGSGNSYVTGRSYNQSASYNIVTVKYDPSGVQLWSVEYDNGYNNTDEGKGICLDAQGNVFVAGFVYNSNSYYDYITIKYDNNGNLLWSQTANGSGNSYDNPSAITVDQNTGNVFVTGAMYTSNSYTDDYGTVAYDNNGNFLWKNEFNNPNYYYSYDYAVDLVVDGAGNVFVTGNTNNQYLNGYRYQDYGTIKIDPNGTTQWFNSFDLMNDYYGYFYGNYDDAKAIAIDASGNVAITGYCRNNYLGSGHDINTVCYDNNGNRMWLNSYNGPSYSNDYGYDITTDGSGNFYIGGSQYNNNGGDNMVAIKLDQSGNQQWISEYNGASNNTDQAYNIALDSNSNVYLSGNTYNNNQQMNFGVVSFDNNGTQLWAIEYNGSGSGYDYLNKKALAVDSTGSIYITGRVYGASGGNNYATVKYCNSPVAAEVITGTPVVCQGQTAVTYSVTAIQHATGYNWVLPLGATITAGANTNSITVDFGNNAVTGDITVQGTNSCSNGAFSTDYSVIVNPLPIAAGTISGPANVCVGQTFVNYSVSVITFATVYTWTLPAGATIVAGNNTNSISVNFALNAASGNITVKGTNSCGDGTISANFPIIVNPLPAAAGAIVGLANVCQGQMGITYSIVSIANATGYNWTLPAGATIISGANTNSISVDYSANAASGNVMVTGTNTCGNGAVKTLAVTVNPLVAAAGTVNGLVAVCAGQMNVNYFVNTIANAAGYNWVLPAGATIISGANTNSIVVNFANNAVSGNVSVNGSNICGTGTASVLAVTVNPLPDVAGIITGSDTVCAGQMGVTYSVASIANATGYNWTLPSGATIATGANTNIITIDFGAGAMNGMILVEGTNSCGIGTSSSFSIVVNSPVAATSIMGPLAVCEGQIGVMYSVSPIANALGYNWSLPIGATIAAGANTNVIWVDFAANAVSGTISVAGTNACGTGVVTSIAVTVNPMPIVTFSLAVMDTVCLDEWHQNGFLLIGGTPARGNYSGLGTVNGFFYPALAGVGTHVITYTYTNAIGCSNTATDTIFVSTCTNVTELGNNNNISVYPNPTKGSFTINGTFASDDKANILLCNMFGELVLVIENGNIATTYNKQVNIDELANGIYFLTIQTNGNNVTTKIVKN